MEDWDKEDFLPENPWKSTEFLLFQLKVFLPLAIQIINNSRKNVITFAIFLPSHQKPRRVKRPMYPKNFCTSTLSPSEPADLFSNTTPRRPIVQSEAGLILEEKINEIELDPCKYLNSNLISSDLKLGSPSSYL